SALDRLVVRVDRPGDRVVWAGQRERLANRAGGERAAAGREQAPDAAGTECERARSGTAAQERPARHAWDRRSPVLPAFLGMHALPPFAPSRPRRTLSFELRASVA